MTPPSVLCNKCRRWKRPHVMYRINQRGDGVCKQCYTLSKREYRARRPEVHRRNNSRCYYKMREDAGRLARYRVLAAKRQKVYRMRLAFKTLGAKASGSGPKSFGQNGL